MTVRALQLSVIAACLTGVFASCKREDDTTPDTNATRIIGSWRERYRAADGNSNGRVDSAERMPTTYYRVMTFYTNGSVRDTAYINGVASNIDASYTIDDRSLRIVFPGMPSYRIMQLDTGTLVLRDTSLSPELVTGFTKQ